MSLGNEGEIAGFQGVAYSNMDGKGRVAIPARHRACLREHYESRGEMIITVHHQARCLVLRPPQVWRQLAEDIGALPNAEFEVQLLQRKLLGYAQEVALDANGRALLSPALRDYAGLRKRVAVAGLGERLELWNIEDWEREVDRTLELDNPRFEGLRL